MPVRSLLLGSASVAALVLSTLAHAQAPAPDFGGSWSLRSSAAAGTGAGSVAVPPSLLAAPAAPVASPVAATPTAPGANPFAAVAAPATAPVPAAAPNPAAPAFGMEAPEVANDDDASGKVDESALRYYASQREMGRVGAEIRRLKALHPGWQPPADLFETGVKVNEQPVWDLYASGDFSGAQGMIETLRADNAGWEPSADLQDKLADGQARASMSSAVTTSNWTGVIEAAKARPSLLTCDHIDVLWNVGEAFARTQNPARSYDLYSYVLNHCDDSAQRLATVQKASAVLPPQGAQALIALGRTGANGRGEFDSLRFDPLRGQMGKVASHEALDLPDPAVLSSFASYVGDARSASDAALFGWYYFGQEKWSDAAGWFKAAGQLDPDPKNIEGYVLSLRNGGDLDAASRLAYDNRDRSPDIARIYIEITSEQLTGDTPVQLDETALGRFEASVELSRSALGAQSLGWNLVDAGKPEAAKPWFARSVEWEPTREGVLGLAVVASRMKDKSGLKAVKAEYGARFPEIAEFKTATPPGKPIAPAVRRGRTPSGGGNSGGGSGGGGGGGSSLLSQAQKQFDSGNYKGAIAALDNHDQRYGHNRGAELLRGWTNIKMRRFADARKVFEAEDKRGSTKDTRFGIGAAFNSQYNAWRE